MAIGNMGLIRFLIRSEKLQAPMHCCNRLHAFQTLCVILIFWGVMSSVAQSCQFSAIITCNNSLYMRGLWLTHMACLQIWDTFMDYIEPYSSRAPYMISIGPLPCLPPPHLHLQFSATTFCLIPVIIKSSFRHHGVNSWLSLWMRHHIFEIVWIRPHSLC